MKKSGESPSYVTRAEFDALINTVGVVLAGTELAHRRQGYADGDVRFQLERAAQRAASTTECATLKQISKAFDTAIDQHHAAERRRESERGNAYHRVSG